MGNGASKVSFWSDKKSKPFDKEPTYFKINQLKHDENMLLHTDCVSPHFGRNGLSFYASLVDDMDNGKTTRHGFEHISKPLTDSSKVKEREIVAGQLVKQTLDEKVRKARLTDEKRLLVLRRRGRKEEELRNKYEGKIKAAEERKQGLQRRLRPPNSKVRSLKYKDESCTNV